MENIFNKEGIHIIAAEALIKLQEDLTVEFPDIVIVDALVLSNIIDNNGEVKYVPMDGVKHFDIRTSILAKEKELDFETFSENIIHPMTSRLAEKINALRGEYAMVPLFEPVFGVSSIPQENNVTIRVVYGFDEQTLSSYLSIDVLLVQKRQPKVFLGGTCNGSRWRDAIIPELKIGYFNPVVDNWTPECMAEEEKQRKECDFCLYVITPRMMGVYSIAEAIFDSVVRPEKAILCIVRYDQHPDDPQNSSITYGDHETKALIQSAKLFETFGAKSFQTLQECANYLNSFA